MPSVIETIKKLVRHGESAYKIGSFEEAKSFAAKAESLVKKYEAEPGKIPEAVIKTVSTLMFLVNEPIVTEPAAVPPTPVVEEPTVVKPKKDKAKKKTTKKKPAAKVTPTKATPKKDVKDRAPKALKEDGVSGLVREMLQPEKGKKVAGCTFSQASKAVNKKFGRDLYPSEFRRNYLLLKKKGVLDELLPAKFKIIPDTK